MEDLEEVFDIMMIFIKDKVYTENNMLSVIVGQHGKKPWDFEMIVPAVFKNRFLENCLYTDIMITGINNTRELSPKQIFTITKIEQIIDGEQNEYIVSGIGKAEYLLQASVALWKLSYNPGESGVQFVNRVLRTFTGMTWIISQMSGGASMDFPEIEKGQFLSDWFWNNFKKEKAICTIKTLSEPGYYNLEIIGAKGVDSKIISRFISKTSVWEKYFNAGYALGNSSIFRFGKTKGKLFFSNEVKSGSFSAKNLNFKLPIPGQPFYAGNSTYTDTIASVIKVRSFNNSGGNFFQGKLAMFSYQHQYSASAFGSPHKSVEVLLMPNTTIDDDPTGRVAIFTVNGAEISDVVSKLRVVKIDYNANPPSITDLPFRIDGDYAYYDQWPLVRNFNSNQQYGILCSHSYEEGFVMDPVTSPLNHQGLLDVLALSGITFKFPEGNPTVDYEIAEEQFNDKQVGDNIVTLEGVCSILTDKVVSYENGEVHYDCTTKDLLEIEVKQ